MIKYLKVLWPLFIVQFFTWLGLFSLWIYTTPVVMRYVFNSNGLNNSNYSKALNWVAYCFAFYSLLAGFLGFLVHRWSKRIGLYRYHSLSLFLGGLGLVSLSILTSPYPFLLSFSLIGIAWSSIGNVPYAILGEIAPETDSERIYIIFNFSIVIPQVVAAFFLGFITDHSFGGETNLTLRFGGGCLFLAAFIMYLIKPLPKIE